MIKYEVDGIMVKAQTKPDLFSPKGLDQGSRLLLKCIPKLKFNTVLDWGCGWGAIALWVAVGFVNTNVTALDSDIGAIKTAIFNKRLNQLDNLNIVLSHGFEELPQNVRFDLICSNPPTHRGREVVEEMIKESFTRLNSGGNLLIVVESRLKPWVMRQMKSTFENCKICKHGSKNVVLLAQKS